MLCQFQLTQNVAFSGINIHHTIFQILMIFIVSFKCLILQLVLMQVTIKIQGEEGTLNMTLQVWSWVFFLE